VVKTEEAGPSQGRSLRAPNTPAAIPTGPRAHAHGQGKQSPGQLGGPSSASRESAAGKPEPKTPVSASSVTVTIPTIKLYDPVSEEEKIRREKFKEERKREEARGRELQRQLDIAMHEYEMARLDLAGVEKRRALAEVQLERLTRADAL